MAEDMAVPGGGGGGGGGKKTSVSIEKIYQKKSQLEHILLRPDSYIGSVEKVTESMWVFDKESEMMVVRDITYVPGLYKIFDEILVNAADNKQRDAKMDCIKITINAEDNMISIWNNGEGIPIVEHKEEKMYVPTMIFGHLLTSSNYNDEEEKVTGGRNGYGAKLCNIFSTKFVVETSSAKYKRAFKQTWTNNMGKESDVKLKDSHGDDYTKITFYPDLTKFKMDKLDKDIVDLMSRRAYDVAASTRGVKVFLNDSRLPIKTFKDYIDLYIKGKSDDSGNPYKVVYESTGPRWEVAVTISEKGFQQVSFVNSIATTKGGRHIDYVSDMIVKQVIEQTNKKNKGGMQVKPFQVRQHMWLFVNCLIVNPTFDSQTKENMTLQIKNFGSKCTLSEKFMSNVAKSGLVEHVISWAKFKAQAILEKASGGKKVNKLKGVPKLEDANDAGTKHSLDCTLILTEGDSAKTLAVAGLSVIGRDRYGVFPLRGKLLNVREASHKQILENAEINNIIKIMGLQYKKKYETREDMATLRYGKIMIMTDQDQDGSHIKGLIVNFIHTNWPSLIRMPFLEVFITPLVKAFRKENEESFFSLPEFDEWKRNTANWKSYRIKYYKGLGTSTSKEAKEYFTNMDRHRIRFKYSGPECDQHIVMAFSKKCVDQRKEWLTNWMTERKRRKALGLPEEYLYTKDTRSITFKDFINKELVLFSNMDNERSIPSMVDGLKPGQRKVLFTCFKRNDKREIKVAQLAGSVAEHSAYHHGEASLMGTIINLAQNFIGSNNINLLQPIGQFGTRLQGGKDSASPRYIFTKLSSLARMIFHPHDDPVLQYQFEDNQKIEPIWYIPIIPMVLVNGAEGIGTGWATKIPNYNPRELVINLKGMIEGNDPCFNLKPWYKGFRGDIDFLIDGKYVVSGEIGIINEDKVEITELPVGTWTQNYKETVLEPMVNGTEKVPATIQEYKEYHTDVTVKFIVSMSMDKLNKAEEQGLHKIFKLQTTISTSQMCCFDQDICLRRFDSVMDILKEFFNLRLEYYQKRKDYMVGMLEAEANKLSNQARFIIEKCAGSLTVENKKKIAMVKELIDKKYASDPVKEWKNKQQSLEEQMAEAGEDGGDDDDDDDEVKVTKVDTSSSGPDFDYLLGMNFWSVTLERKEELIRKKNEKLEELNVLKMKTPGDIWNTDLDKFLDKLDEVEAKEKEDQLAIINHGSKPKTGKGAGSKKRVSAKFETVPNPNARRIEPVIADDLKKKAETAFKLKERKANKKAKGAKGDDDEDEFDKLEKEAGTSLAAKLGNSPSLIEKKARKKKIVLDGSSPTSKKGRGKKKKKDSSDDSDRSINSDFSDDDDVFMKKGAAVVAAPARTVARRSAANNVKFQYDSDSEKSGFSSDSDDIAPIKLPPKSMKSDSESDMDAPKKNGNVIEESNDKLFDSLLNSSENKNDKPVDSANTSDDIILTTPPKKEAKSVPKSKPAGEEKVKKPRGKAAAKKKAISDSDDDEPKKPAKRPKKAANAEPKKPAPKRKKKKNESSDDDMDFKDDDLSSSPVVAVATSSGRARKPVIYNMDNDSDDSM